jgi:diacylglycerol kinase family enzyme
MKVLLVNNPCAGHGRARRITMVSEHPKTLSPDGELIGETQAEVECLHWALEVFC